MNVRSFYIDSCIYLNLWKKEQGVRFGKPFWFVAKKLFEKIENENWRVYYSGYLLKELSFVVPKFVFFQKIKLFNYSSNFKRVDLTEQEYELARRIEKQIKFKISLYDIVHMILAKKTMSILITRDKKLIRLAKEHGVIVKKPEDLV